MAHTTIIELDLSDRQGHKILLVANHDTQKITGGSAQFNTPGYSRCFVGEDFDGPAGGNSIDTHILYSLLVPTQQKPKITCMTCGKFMALCTCIRPYRA